MTVSVVLQMVMNLTPTHSLCQRLASRNAHAHRYLQSPMVKEQLETLTMLRMALDVGAGMQYLAESGFVVRFVRLCRVKLFQYPCSSPFPLALGSRSSTATLRRATCCWTRR